MNVDHRSKITLIPEFSLSFSQDAQRCPDERSLLLQNVTPQTETSQAERRARVPSQRERDAKAQLARRQGPTGKQLRLFYLCSLLCLLSHLLHGVHVGGLRAAGLISVLFCSCSTPRKFQANPCPAQCCSLCPLISSLAVVWELNWSSGLPL